MKTFSSDKTPGFNKFLSDLYLVVKQLGIQLLVGLLMALALVVSVYKDVQHSLPLPIDLRNRMVGSRLLKDGSSPYFFVWKNGDSIRYYDKYVLPDAEISNSTSTPFFHQLMGTIAGMPQYQLNTFWLFFQYFSVFACVVLTAVAIPKYHNKKYYFLTAIAISFTYTFGWRIHVFVGQNYILIPLFSILCCCAITQKKSLFSLFVFAAAACSLILLRPLIITLFIPFLFYFKRYYQWFCSCVFLMLVYIGFVYNNAVMKLNWADYFKMLPIAVRIHQSTSPSTETTIRKNISVLAFEGISIDEKTEDATKKVVMAGLENNNLFILFYKITGSKLSVSSMIMICIILSLLSLIPLFIARWKGMIFSPVSLFILGFVIYYYFELASPILRMAYYWAQFLFPLLLMPLFIQRLYLIPVAFLLTGFCLNIAVLPAIKMEHSIGEVLIIIAMLYLVYRQLLTKYVNENKFRLQNGIYLM